MTAMVRTEVVPEAAVVGALSAQLRRPRSRSATAGLRRYETSPHVSQAQIAAIRRGLASGHNQPFADARHGWFQVPSWPSALKVFRQQRREQTSRAGPHAIGQEPFHIVNNVRYDRPNKGRPQMCRVQFRPGRPPPLPQEYVVCRIGLRAKVARCRACAF
jgi:hypothetical protein